jgi:uncharacterized protein
MAPDTEGFALADWRRTVAELYARVRQAAGAGDEARRRAIEAFRAERDRLFRDHPCSPLASEARGRFAGLSYYPYDPRWQLTGTADFGVERYRWEVALPEGPMRCTRIAVVTFAYPHATGALDVFWIEGYGGGLFLPFQDGTTGEETYSGGRYLYDSIKGADLGTFGSAMSLDFNYAYNPSCAYSDAWVCPLAPAKNRVPLKITAGEKDFRR